MYEPMHDSWRFPAYVRAEYPFLPSASGPPMRSKPGKTPRTGFLVELLQTFLAVAGVGISAALLASALSSSGARAETSGPLVPQGPEIRYFWATPVHNLMIDTAFPGEDWRCQVEIKKGSRHADSAAFQSGPYSHMHAMRLKGEKPAQAARKMWRYIEDKYAEARVLIRDGRQLDACFIRGMALHPIMDSTSPAHKHFAEWDPVEWRDLLQPSVFVGKLAEMARHGDFQKYLDRLLLLPFQMSGEDMSVIDEHPEFLRITSDLMLSVDKIELLGV